jgi:hypothetical protein
MTNLLKNDWKINIFWVSLLVSLIIALYFAYLETVQENNLLDIVLPHHIPPQIIESNDTIIIQKKTPSNFNPSNLEPPFIPRFIILWGYIGSAVYVLKVTTGKLREKQGFDLTHLPDHLARLFIGTIIAVFTFFVLVTGGFFGLTIDVTKISNPEFIEYVYAAIAFISGYSVRHIVKLISTFLNAVFRLDAPDERKGNENVKD